MSITKRGSSYQVTLQRDGERYRRSFKSLQDAEVWELESKADLISGRPVSMGSKSTKRLPRTLQELADYTYKTVWAGTPSEEKVWINVKQILSSIGPSTLVRNIDKMSIDRMVDDFRDRGNSNATINRKLSALSKMFTVALELGVIDTKPTIKKFKVNQTRFRWFTGEEQDSIHMAMHQLGHPEYADIVRVLLDTGMRCGELFGLSWKCVQGNIIVLEGTKSGKVRSIPMTPRVREIIDSQDHPEGPFRWSTYYQFRKAWNKMKGLLRWEDDEQATPHACRHTFCTKLVRSGVPIPHVAKLAGHSTIQMTMRYAQVAPEDLESAIAKIVPLQSG